MEGGGVWHCFYGCADDRMRYEVLEALAAVGFDTTARDTLTAQGAGVIFFSEVTPDVCRHLHDASGRGLQRVLAVALSHEWLANGASWSLLKSGASDVLKWDRNKNTAREIVARFERWRQIDATLRSQLVKKNLAGESPAWVR